MLKKRLREVIHKIAKEYLDEVKFSTRRFFDRLLMKPSKDSEKINV